MPRRSRRRPSGAYVVSIIALVVASAGSAVAATVITGKNVKDGSLTGKDVKKNALGSGQIKNGSITAKDINGSAPLTGPTGPQGPQGIQGPPGVANVGAGNPQVVFKRVTLAAGAADESFLVLPGLGTLRARCQTSGGTGAALNYEAINDAAITRQRVFTESGATELTQEVSFGGSLNAVGPQLDDNVVSLQIAKSEGPGANQRMATLTVGTDTVGNLTSCEIQAQGVVQNAG